MWLSPLLVAGLNLALVLARSISYTNTSRNEYHSVLRRVSWPPQQTRLNAAPQLVSLSLPELDFSQFTDSASEEEIEKQINDWYNWKGRKPFTWRSTGEGITVFIIDTGASPEIPEYRAMRLKPKWQYFGVPEREDDPGQHGRYVLSVIAGPTYGVAPDAQTWILKVPFREASERLKPISDEAMKELIDTFADVLKWVINEAKGQPPGATEISWSGALPPASSQFQIQQIERLLPLMKKLAELGVPMFVGAGNERQTTEDIDRYPALWASEIDAIIPVGAVTRDGLRTYYSQGGPLVALWAVGDVECASSFHFEPADKSGTSLATGVATGLGASLLSIPGFIDPNTPTKDIPRVLKEKMQQMSWVRPFLEYKVISNDVERLTSS